MDLLERNEREFFDAESGLEFLSVSKDIFAGIPIGETEVENLAAIEIRNSARGSTETVDKPRDFGEWLEQQNFQAADGFEVPVSCDFGWRCGTRKRSARFAALQWPFSSRGHLISIIGNRF